MKDRIMFFVLGAVLATVAYFVGDMDKVTAQSDITVFEDVLINGTLTVAGGRILVHNDRNLTEEFGDLDGTIDIGTHDRGASIIFYNGSKHKNSSEFESKLTIGALDMRDGSKESLINFVGENGEYNWVIWSTRELNEGLFK